MNSPAEANIDRRRLPRPGPSLFPPRIHWALVYSLLAVTGVSSILWPPYVLAVGDEPWISCWATIATIGAMGCITTLWTRRIRLEQAFSWIAVCGFSTSTSALALACLQGQENLVAITAELATITLILLFRSRQLRLIATYQRMIHLAERQL